MSKKLLLKFEAGKGYPPILLEIAIPDNLALVIQNTPITSTTLNVVDSVFLTKAAQAKELKDGELNRFRIL